MKLKKITFLSAAFLAMLVLLPTEKDVTASSNAEIETKYVAITFDDGPRADTTSRLLDGLAERNVHATFFVIGEQISGNEGLIERMAAQGHQVGNHTYNHTMLSKADDGTIVQQINKTDVILKELLGDGEYWLRPPYGLIRSESKKLVKTPMITWSVDPEDWKLLDTQKVVDAVMGEVGDGDIVLLHDFYPTSVDASLIIIDKLKEQGYEFVTVRELLKINGITAEPGAVYHCG